jgi:hypothetical protein
MNSSKRTTNAERADSPVTFSNHEALAYSPGYAALITIDDEVHPSIAKIAHAIEQDHRTIWPRPETT